MLTAPSSLSEGVFGAWQGEYAKRGLPTFPVKIDGADKKPAIRGWQNVGLRGSTELAGKLASISALGIALNQQRMIVDIDTNSENVLTDVLNRYGNTPLIARTASKGGFHAYYGENANAWQHYKHSRRVIRPEAERPIDYLGSGFAVVPPSVTASGRYEFICGNLDHITQLPPFKGVVPPLEEEAYPSEEAASFERNVGQGTRNKKLFNACIRRARICSKFDQLLAFAQDINAYYRPPMDDREVISICKSVWRYEQTGQNRSGHHGAWFPIEEVTALLLEPDTLLLLAFLRAHNRPLAQFMLANGLSKSFGWGDKRLAAARQRLIELGYLEEIRAASRHKAGRFQWAKSKSPFRGGRRGKV